MRVNRRWRAVKLPDLTTQPDRSLYITRSIRTEHLPFICFSRLDGWY